MPLMELSSSSHLGIVLRLKSLDLVPPGSLAVQVSTDFRSPNGTHCSGGISQLLLKVHHALFKLQLAQADG
jgi:hypothetical protein